MSHASADVATPTADGARVAAIRGALDLSDGAAMAAYGERVRKEVVASVERLLSEVRSTDLADSLDIIRVAGDAIGALDAGTLEPRRGLAGLFDSRSARLKRLRTAFSAASQTVDGLRGDLDERAQRLTRRVTSLDALHGQTRVFLLELEAYVEAARLAIADAERPVISVPRAVTSFQPALAPEAAPGPAPMAPVYVLEPKPAPEPEEPRPEDAFGFRAVDPSEKLGVVVPLRPEPVATFAAEPAREMLSPHAELTAPAPDQPVSAGPSPLELLKTRHALLKACRDAALPQLALVRSVQNIDGPLAERLLSVSRALVEWRASWSERLGLNGKAKGRVRPDAHALADASTATLTAVRAPIAELSEGKTRRTVTEDRMQKVVEAVRKG